MVTLTALWLPILIAAVLVFIASSLIHVVLNFHRSDFSKLPGEDSVVEAMHKAGVRAGNYCFPYAASRAEMNSPEIMKKWERGPAGFMIVWPAGPPTMGASLALWFIYTVLVGVAVAYVTGRTLEPGVEYLQVFRVSGTVAFLCYAGAEPVASIWFKRRWSATAKHMLDGLVYGLLTAGAFGWLWPE